MNIKQIARVSRSPDEVWAMLSNVPMVVACIPGAELGNAVDTDRYRGSFRVRIGPLSAKIDGEGRVERDEASRSARITGHGVDKRGGSRVSASIDYRVVAKGTGSAIEISADVDLSGPLAQVGRTNIIMDVAKRLTDEFSMALEKSLDASTDVQARETGNEPGKPAEQSPRSFDAGRALKVSIWTRLKSFIKQFFNR